MNAVSGVGLHLVLSLVSLWHGLEMEVQRRDDRLVVTVSYSGGAPVEGAAVRVTTASGTPSVEGATSASGTFDFPVPDAPEIVIVAETVDHRVEVRWSETGFSSGSLTPAQVLVRVGVGLGLILVVTVVTMAWLRRRNSPPGAQSESPHAH